MPPRLAHPGGLLPPRHFLPGGLLPPRHLHPPPPDPLPPSPPPILDPNAPQPLGPAALAPYFPFDSVPSSAMDADGPKYFQVMLCSHYIRLESVLRFLQKFQTPTSTVLSIKDSQPDQGKREFFIDSFRSISESSRNK
jgi:hypothetical protein